MQDVYYSIIFYVLFIGFGIIGFTVLSLVIKKHKLLLYTVSKPFGLALVAYPIWLLSSLKLLNFQNTIAIRSIFLFALFTSIGFLILNTFRKYKEDKRYIRKDVKFIFVVIALEFFSFLLYAGYLYIKSFNPKIEGTEKFMDLNLLMSAGKTDYFPFIDSWWAGKNVNYYYYGFYLLAFATRLVDIPFSVTYNLSLGLILVQTFIISLAISYKVYRGIIAAFIGACLVTFAGNLHYAYCFVSNFGPDLNSKCFYPKATRILDPSYTINEIPSYSFILGDLHPHVISIPFFLVGVYLLLLIFKQKIFSWKLHLAFGFIATTAALVNFWDFMTLGFLLAIIIAYKLIKSSRILKKQNEKYLFALLGTYNLVLVCFTLYSYNFTSNIKWIIIGLMFCLFVIFTFIFLRLMRHKKRFYSLLYSGWISFLGAFGLMTSNWLVYLIISALSTAGFILFQILKKHFNKEINIDKKYVFSNLLVLNFTAVLPFVLFLPFFLNFKSPVTGIGFSPDFVAYNSFKYSDMQYPSSFAFLFGIWGIYIVLSLVSVVIIVLSKRYKVQQIIFPSILIGVSVFWIWFSEVFFFQDLFHIANPLYFRANTVFKLTYHSWILIGIATAVLLGLAWQSLINIKSKVYGLMADIGYLVLVSLASSCVFLYPFIAVKQAFNPVFPWENKNDLTLDGSKYLEVNNKADYETIKWINKNLKERVVILESAGEAYSYNARISANTGMINVINWETHEWTWRFRYPAGFNNWRDLLNYNNNGNIVDTGYDDIASTSAEVKLVYETEDVNKAKSILDKYQVKYIYVGAQERKTYINLKEDKFKVIGEPVFRYGNSVLYKVR